MPRSPGPFRVAVLFSSSFFSFVDFLQHWNVRGPGTESLNKSKNILKIVRGAAAELLLQQLGGNRLGDLLAVEAAIFNEDLIRMHPGHDHARQVNALALALERLWIGARPQDFGVDRDA